jgi:hypothetical protein
MQDLSKHFQYLWRFNAVVMAVIGLAIIVAFIASVLSPLWNESRSDQAGAFVPLPQDAQSGYTYKLGSDAIRLAGTSETIFVLRRWKGSSASSSGAQDVNLLAVNGDSAASHWLFGGASQHILSRDELHASDVANYNETSPVMALVVKIADTDSDKHRESLCFYRVGGGSAVKFFTADRILAGQQVGADRYLVVYENSNVAASALFSIIDLKMLSKKSLPAIPN